MLKKERHAFILRYVAVHGRAISSVLSGIMEISEDTVRRDLQELDAKGLLVKVHGGALAPGFDVPGLPSPPSRIIARKLAKLVSPGSFLLTCGGEALVELFAMVPGDFRATLFTVSMAVATRGSEHPGFEVILIGDKILRNAKLAAGGEAVSRIRQIRADLCLLDARALHPSQGITESSWEIAQVKKAMIESSAAVACLAESSSLGKLLPVQAAGLRQLTYLVTELHPDDPLLEEYRQAGMTIV